MTIADFYRQPFVLRRVQVFGHDHLGYNAKGLFDAFFGFVGEGCGGIVHRRFVVHMTAHLSEHDQLTAEPGAVATHQQVYSNRHAMMKRQRRIQRLGHLL